MKIRRFFGKDMREALRLVKEELGGDAVIMSNKKVANGIELVVAVDRETELSKPTPTIQANKATPSLSDIIGESGPDSLRALLEKQNSPSQTQVAQLEDERREASIANDSYRINNQKPSPYIENTQVSPILLKGNNKAKTESRINKDDELSDIKEELTSIRNVLQFQVSGLLNENQKNKNPLHFYLTNKLLGMGLSADLAKQLMHYIPQNLDEKKSWDAVLKLLSNRMMVSGNDILTQAGVVALVGPTGTGKTTTLAKLAAKYAQKHGANEVAVVTIDTYRIAAYEQLATYGKIIGCVVKRAQNSDELSHVLHQLRHKKLILIDSAGFSQRDTRLIQQIKEFETDASVNIKKYLVLQAGTQRQVLKKTINAYKNVNLSGCIFTKLDECYSLGEMLSVAIEHDLPLSYVTDGQRVPEDIKLADAKNLVLVAAKLYRKYGEPLVNGSVSAGAVQAI